MKAIASVLLIAVACAVVFLSDLYIRAEDLHDVNGIDAESWDVSGTILLILGIMGFIYAVFIEEKD